jgi:PAS domain S-box-containing protein
VTSPLVLPPLLQSAPAPIASLNLHGQVLDVNKALLQASGYTAEELRGQPFLAFLDRDDEENARVRFAELASGARDSYRAVRRYRTRSGEMREVDLSVSLVRDAAGAPELCLAALQDLTEHARALEEAARRAAELKEAEEALRLSEARYRALVEQSPLSVQILSPDGRTLQVNTAWERLWDVTLEELGDYNMLEDRQLVERGLMPYIRKAFEGSPAHLPAILYDRDRSRPDLSRHDDPRRWVRAVIYPVKDAAGGVREVVLIHEDITDQVRADEERRAATELLQLVVQQSGEAIVVSDADGVIRIFNPAAERLHGVAGEATPQAEWSERYRLSKVDGTALPFEETALYRAMHGAIVRDARWIVSPPDGPPRTLVGSAAPLRRPDGSPAGAVLIARDNTDNLAAEAERERLLADTQRAHRDIEAASRMKDEFLATLSHELRTPLNAVLGWTRILRSREYDATTMHALTVIERNASAQARLIDDLLDVSRIIAGKLQLQLEPVDFGQLAAAALETVRPAADAKGVSLEAVIEPGLPTLNGDVQRLQQVLWNLLSNAVKFNDQGGRVRVQVESEPCAIRVTVSDTGSGIPPALLPFVFDRFTQAESSGTRKATGLGLGLAIVRYLVELHGGTVSAASAGEGQGATFQVWLPVLRN